MSNRTFVIILIVVGIIVAAALVMHTPGGRGLTQSMRSLHGSRD
jgi:uncharacterized membrane protein YbhN (UPF0104 family)